MQWSWAKLHIRVNYPWKDRSPIIPVIVTFLLMQNNKRLIRWLPCVFCTLTDSAAKESSVVCICSLSRALISLAALLRDGTDAVEKASSFLCFFTLLAFNSFGEETLISSLFLYLLIEISHYFIHEYFCNHKNKKCCKIITPCAYT